MELFQGSISGKAPSGILSHFGSLLAAVQRMDSTYATQQLRSVDKQGIFTIYDSNFQPLRTETSQESLHSFASYMQKVTVAQYTLDIQNPLRLTDCWMDDPIGSGALEIFQDNKDLSDAERKELEKLFHPFRNVIYPVHIHLEMSRNKIKEIKKQGEKNAVFKDELCKRKQRSAAIGEDWASAEPQEIVWTDLTVKLRDWALKNKYDAFVYKNNEEDQSSDSYVTLKSDNILKCAAKFKFNSELFLEKVPPIFETFAKETRMRQPKSVLITDIYWAGFEPTQFWTQMPT